MNEENVCEVPAAGDPANTGEPAASESDPRGSLAGPSLTLRQPWADVAAREAKRRGMMLLAFLGKAVEHWWGCEQEQKAREAAVAREIVRLRRDLERQRDDALQSIAGHAVRAEAAEEAETKTLSAWFRSIERRIGEMDFANVPEPGRHEFLYIAGLVHGTEADPAEDRQ